jgi:hypothetical protein
MARRILLVEKTAMTLIEIAGMRVLIDPPSLVEHAGPVDIVLLSRDPGSELGQLIESSLTLTTRAAAMRLRGSSIGLIPGEACSVDAPGGARVKVTATSDGGRPDAIGFLISASRSREDSIACSAHATRD